MAHYLTHSYPLLIREAHLDTFGHVNNAVYLEIFEEARWDFISNKGFSLATIHKKMQGPIILEINLKFIKELVNRTPVIIKTKVDSYHGKVGALKQWIENQDGQIYCEAQFKVGLFDMRERRLILPTQEWLTAIGLAD